MAVAVGTLAPSPKFVGVDDAGNPIAGGKIYSYYAGTTTPAPTFSDADLDVSHVNTNPIVLDSAGRATIFLQPGVSYKFILLNAADVQVWSQDNIAAVSPLQTGIDTLATAGEALAPGQVAYLAAGAPGPGVAGRWYRADSANAYSSTEPTVGMVTSPILAGQSGSIRVVGAVTGLSGLVPGANYFVGTAGALTVTRPLNGRLVGVADTTTSLVLSANPASAAAGSSAAAVITVTTAGLIPTLPIPNGTGPLVVRMAAAALATIQGIAPGLPGQKLTIIEATNVQQVDLLSMSAAAGNVNQRLYNVVQTGPTSLKAGGVAVYVYDAGGLNVWKLVSHQQGQWIQLPYAATRYTAAAGAWDVQAADEVYYGYSIAGCNMSLMAIINTSSISLSTGSLSIALPAGFAYQRTSSFAVIGSPTGSSNEVFLAVVQPSGFLLLLRLAGAWAPISDSMGLAFTIMIPMT